MDIKTVDALLEIGAGGPGSGRHPGDNPYGRLYDTAMRNRQTSPGSGENRDTTEGYKNRAAYDKAVRAHDVANTASDTANLSQTAADHNTAAHAHARASRMYTNLPANYKNTETRAAATYHAHMAVIHKDHAK